MNIEGINDLLYGALEDENRNHVLPNNAILIGSGMLPAQLRPQPEENFAECSLEGIGDRQDVAEQLLPSNSIYESSYAEHEVGGLSTIYQIS